MERFRLDTNHNMLFNQQDIGMSKDAFNRPNFNIWKAECENAQRALRFLCDDEDQFRSRLRSAEQSQPYPPCMDENSVASAVKDFKGHLSYISKATKCHLTQESKDLKEQADKILGILDILSS